MNDSFTFKDKCQLVLYLIDKVEEYWKRLFYSTITIIVALLGDAYTKINSWIVASILGLMFVTYTLSNLVDHRRVYNFLILSIEEIKKNGDKLHSAKLLKKISDAPYKKELTMCNISYIGVIICVIAICVALKLNI